MKRYDSIDVFRAIALIGMVICHYPIFLSSGEGNDALLYFLTNHVLGGDFAASWFVFLVGVSQVISAKKRNVLQSDSTDLRMLIRGAVIFVIGLLFLLIVHGYSELWCWDVLTLIGAAIVILLYCRQLPSWVLLVICIAILFLTPWLRSFIDIASFYGGQFVDIKVVSKFIPNLIFDPLKDYEGASTVLGNIIGFFLIGQFPIFPWIIFPIIGFVIGRRLTENRMPSDAPFLLIIGMLTAFMGPFIAYAGSLIPPYSVQSDYITPFSFYPLSFSMVIFLVGVVLILFIMFWNIFDKDPEKANKPGTFLLYCRQISKYSLTIYITHFALFFIPLRLIYLFTGENYLRRLMSTPSALGLSLILLVIYYPLLRLWDINDGKYSFEWLLAKILSLFNRETTSVAKK